MRGDEMWGQEPAAGTVPVTTCTGGSAVVESYSGQDYAFLTLNFTGSSASHIVLTGVTSPDGAPWRIYPEHPERLTTVGDGCQLQFAASHVPGHSTTATVSLRIDDGPEQSVQVDLRHPGASAPTASGF